MPSRVAVLLSTLLLYLIPTAPVGGEERVRAGYSGVSGYQVPLWLATDFGLFKKYGLWVDPVLFRGGSESTPALATGEIQFDVVSPLPHLASALAGSDIMIVGTYFNRHTYSVAVRPEIRTPEDLRGKKIGVLSVVGLNQIAVAAALKHWGMNERSVTLVRAGGTRERLAALQAGLIDATVLTGAYVQRAREAGIPILLDLGDLADAFPTVSVLTTKRFYTSKRGVVKGFLQGISEAVHIFQTDREKGLKSLSKWMRTQDKTIVENAYTAYAPKMSFPPFTDVSGVQTVLDSLSAIRPDTKTKGAEEFVNEEILRGLEREGFFRAIAKK